MSEEAHNKDWYVAQVVVLTNENKTLKNELHDVKFERDEARSCWKSLIRMLPFIMAMMVAVGMALDRVIMEVLK